MVIEVEQLGGDDPMRFLVTVQEADGTSRHQVTMAQSDYRRLSAGRASPEELVRAAFGFLLEREPKEAILSRFEIMVIARYFPEFTHAFPACLCAEMPKP